MIVTEKEFMNLSPEVNQKMSDFELKDFPVVQMLSTPEGFEQFVNEDAGREGNFPYHAARVVVPFEEIGYKLRIEQVDFKDISSGARIFVPEGPSARLTIVDENDKTILSYGPQKTDYNGRPVSSWGITTLPNVNPANINEDTIRKFLLDKYEEAHVDPSARVTLDIIGSAVGANNGLGDAVRTTIGQNIEITAHTDRPIRNNFDSIEAGISKAGLTDEKDLALFREGILPPDSYTPELAGALAELREDMVNPIEHSGMIQEIDTLLPPSSHIELTKEEAISMSPFDAEKIEEFDKEKGISKIEIYTQDSDTTGAVGRVSGDFGSIDLPMRSLVTIKTTFEDGTSVRDMYIVDPTGRVYGDNITGEYRAIEGGSVYKLKPDDHGVDIGGGPFERSADTPQVDGRINFIGFGVSAIERASDNTGVSADAIRDAYMKDEDKLENSFLERSSNTMHDVEATFYTPLANQEVIKESTRVDIAKFAVGVLRILPQGDMDKFKNLAYNLTNSLKTLDSDHFSALCKEIRNDVTDLRGKYGAQMTKSYGRLSGGSLEARKFNYFSRTIESNLSKGIDAHSAQEIIADPKKDNLEKIITTIRREVDVGKLPVMFGDAADAKPGSELVKSINFKDYKAIRDEYNAHIDKKDWIHITQDGKFADRFGNVLDLSNIGRIVNGPEFGNIFNEEYKPTSAFSLNEFIKSYDPSERRVDTSTSPDLDRLNTNASYMYANDDNTRKDVIQTQRAADREQNGIFDNDKLPIQKFYDFVKKEYDTNTKVDNYRSLVDEKLTDYFNNPEENKNIVKEILSNSDINKYGFTTREIFSMVVGMVDKNSPYAKSVDAFINKVEKGEPASKELNAIKKIAFDEMTKDNVDTGTDSSDSGKVDKPAKDPEPDNPTKDNKPNKPDLDNSDSDKDKADKDGKDKSGKDDDKVADFDDYFRTQIDEKKEISLTKGTIEELKNKAAKDAIEKTGEKSGEKFEKAYNEKFEELKKERIDQIKDAIEKYKGLRAEVEAKYEGYTNKMIKIHTFFLGSRNKIDRNFAREIRDLGGKVGKDSAIQNVATAAQIASDRHTWKWDSYFWTTLYYDRHVKAERPDENDKEKLERYEKENEKLGILANDETKNDKPVNDEIRKDLDLDGNKIENSKEKAYYNDFMKVIKADNKDVSVEKKQETIDKISKDASGTLSKEEYKDLIDHMDKYIRSINVGGKAEDKVTLSRYAVDKDPDKTDNDEDKPDNDEDKPDNDEDKPDNDDDDSDDEKKRKDGAGGTDKTDKEKPDSRDTAVASDRGKDKDNVDKGASDSKLKAMVQKIESLLPDGRALEKRENFIRSHLSGDGKVDRDSIFSRVVSSAKDGFGKIYKAIVESGVEKTKKIIGNERSSVSVEGLKKIHDLIGGKISRSEQKVNAFKDNATADNENDVDKDNQNNDVDNNDQNNDVANDEDDSSQASDTDADGISDDTESGEQKDDLDKTDNADDTDENDNSDVSSDDDEKPEEDVAKDNKVTEENVDQEQKDESLVDSDEKTESAVENGDNDDTSNDENDQSAGNTEADEKDDVTVSSVEQETTADENESENVEQDEENQDDLEKAPDDTENGDENKDVDEDDDADDDDSATSDDQDANNDVSDDSDNTDTDEEMQNVEDFTDVEEAHDVVAEDGILNPVDTGTENDESAEDAMISGQKTSEEEKAESDVSSNNADGKIESDENDNPNDTDAVENEGKVEDDENTAEKDQSTSEGDSEDENKNQENEENKDDENSDDRADENDNNDVESSSESNISLDDIKDMMKKIFDPDSNVEVSGDNGLIDNVIDYLTGDGMPDIDTPEMESNLEDIVEKFGEALDDLSQAGSLSEVLDGMETLYNAGAELSMLFENGGKGMSLVSKILQPTEQELGISPEEGADKLAEAIDNLPEVVGTDTISVDGLGLNVEVSNTGDLTSMYDDNGMDFNDSITENSDLDANIQDPIDRSIEQTINDTETGIENQYMSDVDYGMDDVSNDQNMNVDLNNSDFDDGVSNDQVGNDSADNSIENIENTDMPDTGTETPEQNSDVSNDQSFNDTDISDQSGASDTSADDYDIGNDIDASDAGADTAADAAEAEEAVDAEEIAAALL